MRPSYIGVTVDVKCWRSQMTGDVGVRQLMSDDDVWDEMREQRYQDIVLATSMNVGRE